MRTIKLDILNQKAINLLNPLRVLKLIGLHKKKDTIENTKRLYLSDFSFSRSRNALKDYKGSLSDALTTERKYDH